MSFQALCQRCGELNLARRAVGSVHEWPGSTACFRLCVAATACRMVTQRWQTKTSYAEEISDKGVVRQDAERGA